MPTILVIGILRPDHGAYVDAWLALKEWANVGRRLNQKTPLARYVRATSLRYDPHWSALVHNTLWTQEALWVLLKITNAHHGTIYVLRPVADDRGNIAL